MTATPDLRAIQDRSSQALFDFLNVELDLGFTFADLARSKAQTAHAATLTFRAQQAIEVVEHFEGRLKSATARSSVKRRAEQLRRLLSAKPQADPYT